MARSKKFVGRIDFVFRIVLITILCRAFEFLFSRDTASDLTLLPRYIHVIEGAIAFGLLGSYVVKAINGRILDAGLSRWYVYPAFSVWLFPSLIPTIRPNMWIIQFALFTVLLFLGSLAPSKQVPLTFSLGGERADEYEYGTSFSPTTSKLRSAGPVSFLRSLLTIGCLCCPLILLDTSSVQGAGVWVARIGYLILGLIWLPKLLGRLEDTGCLSSPRLGYSVVAALLLMKIIRRMEGAGQSFHFYGFSISDAGRTITSLLSWLRFINGYEVLAVFLLIQVPLALLPSKFKCGSPASKQKVENRFGKLLAERRRTKKRFLVGPFAFLRRLLVLVVFWIPLIYLDGLSNDGFGSWIARLGFFILIYAWIMNSLGRFEEAGWAEGLYGLQYCLFVSVASLMPLAVHWVNGYGALGIFFLVQVPTVFLKQGGWPGAHL